MSQGQIPVEPYESLQAISTFAADPRESSPGGSTGEVPASERILWTEVGFTNSDTYSWTTIFKTQTLIREQWELIYREYSNDNTATGLIEYLQNNNVQSFNQLFLKWNGSPEKYMFLANNTSKLKEIGCLQ